MWNHRQNPKETPNYLTQTFKIRIATESKSSTFFALTFYKAVEKDIEIELPKFKIQTLSLSGEESYVPAVALTPSMDCAEHIMLPCNIYKNGDMDLHTNCSVQRKLCKRCQSQRWGL